jgi:recombinational DNA repair protein RecR
MCYKKADGLPEEGDCADLENKIGYSIHALTDCHTCFKHSSGVACKICN